NRKAMEMSGLGDLPAVSIFNPLTQDQEIMCPSVLPGLLSVVLTNVNRGQKDLRLFETGRVYSAKGETEVLAAVITGRREDDWRLGKKEAADFYDLKGPIVQTLVSLGLAPEQIRFEAAQEDFLADGESAAVLVDGKRIGVAGKIAADVIEQWNIKQDNCLFAQIDMSGIYARRDPARKYEPVPEFPSISRDISLAVPSGVTARDIEDAIHKTAAKQKDVVLADLKFIEKYEGEKIAEGNRGLVFSLTYRASEARTLRDEEVSEAHEQVCHVLIKDLGLTRR
ncbi:MAG: hypothetical protein U9Q07_14900, partial [Planctomycetota bacterium]|nr:hypothetical protein [Planctomycetota bacterium]